MSNTLQAITSETTELVNIIEMATDDDSDSGLENTFDLFSRMAAAKPDAPALTFLPSGALDAEPVRLSRGDLLGNIRQAANMFHDLGVGPKDVVSFLLPNLLETHYTLWGAQAVGIANPINFLLGVDQIIEICNAAQTKVLVALGPHPTLNIWEKVETLKDRVKSLEKVLIVGGIPKSDHTFLSFHQTIDLYPNNRRTFDHSPAESDIASLFHTGGTTGKPKLVPHTHGNELAAALSTAHMFALSDRDVIVNGLPLFHVAAPILLTLAPLAAGSEVLIPSVAGLRDPLVLENHWKLLQKYGVTIAGGVPTSLSDLARVPLRDADISRVEFALSGGAQLSAGLATRFKRQTGLPIYQIYGMTETSGVIAVTPRGRAPVEGSVGLSVPGVEVKAIQLDYSGQWVADCKPGDTGILAVRGKNVFSGYLNGSQDDNTFVGNGWLNTGDVGHIDSDGWIFITGRAKDVIIRSGHNIDPVSIEEVADSHPAVVSSVAVGQPDARAGEVPVVFITTVTGTQASPKEICQYIASKVPEKPAKPTAVYIIPNLPLTAVGKVYRPKLRCEAISHLIERELDDIKNGDTAHTVTVALNAQGNIDTIISLSGHGTASQSVRNIIDERLSLYAISYSVIEAV